MLSWSDGRKLCPGRGCLQPLSPRASLRRLQSKAESYLKWVNSMYLFIFCLLDRRCREGSKSRSFFRGNDPFWSDLTTFKLVLQPLLSNLIQRSELRKKHCHCPDDRQSMLLKDGRQRFPHLPVFNHPSIHGCCWGLCLCSLIVVSLPSVWSLHLSFCWLFLSGRDKKQ